MIRGARDAELFYDPDPVAVASRWVDAGAECLHVIDLGAAFGEDSSIDVIERIAAQVPIPVQTGGGVRDDVTVERLLAGGIGRVILGTRAFKDLEFLRRVVERHGATRVMVSLDCEGERVKVSGWEAESPLSIDGALEHIEEAGVSRLLVTATDRDGTLSGIRIDLMERVLRQSRAKVVAAGGVGALEHVQEALSLGHERLEGVVVGRALYEGTVDLRAALKLSDAGEA